MRDYAPYVALFGFLILVGLLAWVYLETGNLEEGQYLVEDPHGDRMVIEVSEGLEPRNELEKMYLTGESRWVGGEIEDSENRYGFAFDPDTIVVAEVTAEGLQAVYYEEIAANLSYWKRLGTIYVQGTVIKTAQ